MRKWFLVLIAFLLILSSCTSIDNSTNYGNEDSFYILDENNLSEYANAVLSVFAENNLNAEIITSKNEIPGFRPTSYGSGFAIAPDIIITNWHVIRSKTGRGITIKCNGKVIPATLLVNDEKLDIAVLKIAETVPHYFDIEPSINSSAGQHITVLGYPLPDVLGDSVKITDGIISSSNVPGVIPSLQFSAPIQPGNSGGPAINDSFKIVGVAYSTLGMASQNVNFAIKTDVIFKYAEQYLNKANNCFVKNIEEAMDATVQVISEDILEPNPKHFLVVHSYYVSIGFLSDLKEKITCTDTYNDNLVASGLWETACYDTKFTQRHTRQFLNKMKLVKPGNPIGILDENGKEEIKK